MTPKGASLQRSSYLMRGDGRDVEVLVGACRKISTVALQNPALGHQTPRIPSYSPNLAPSQHFDAVSRQVRALHTTVNNGHSQFWVA